MILGLETSCDETAAAVITPDGRILSNVVSSQADLHARYGGVVPEVASRRHLELVTPVVQEALAEADTSLDDVELLGVTSGPGLIGALLVGVAAAKAIAWARRLPLAAVDHLQGHIASLYLEPEPLEPPFLCLLASGGHTLLLDVQDPRSKPRVLGTTLDDAAGEAFDKGARLLGLSYPGGGRSTGWRAKVIPLRTTSRLRACLDWTSLFRASRRRSCMQSSRCRPGSSSDAGPISPRAISVQSFVPSWGGLSRPQRRPARRESQSWVESLQIRSCAPLSPKQRRLRWRSAPTTRP
jgi:hypothetical protein